MWQLSFMLPEAEAERMPRDGASLRAEALRRLRGWHAPVEDLVGATTASEITGYPAYDRDVPAALRAAAAAVPMGPDASAGGGGKNDEMNDDGADHAGDGSAPPAAAVSAAPPPLAPSCPCTLLGDAMHPMSPFKGQGANTALLDAVDLARAIRRSTLGGGKLPLEQALDGFERRMLKRAAVKVAASRAAAAQLHAPSATTSGNCTRAAAARGEGAGDHSRPWHEE